MLVEFKEKIDMICFKIEAGGSKPKDSAKVIDQSLTIFEYSTRERLFFRSSTTDSGSGDTYVLLTNECALVNCLVSDVDYV